MRTSGQENTLAWRPNQEALEQAEETLQHCSKTFWIVRLILPLPAQDEKLPWRAFSSSRQLRQDMACPPAWVCRSKCTTRDEFCETHAQHRTLPCSIVAFVDCLGIATLLSFSASLDMVRKSSKEGLVDGRYGRRKD
jgi:hypothetical protein